MRLQRQGIQSRRKVMGKKEVKNQYGVKVGDIFYEKHTNPCYFYQVVALHGETKVKVCQIGKKCIAFDGYYKCIVPLPGVWISRACICKVQGEQENPGIFLLDSFPHWATLDRAETYMELHQTEDFPFYFRDSYPEIAEQLDLKTGSGVYAVDKPFQWLDDDSRAVIRYPDGREVETVFRELMCSEKITQKMRDDEAKMRKILEELDIF